MDQAYLQEGIEQASRARDLTNNNWADTWKNYAVQYALSKMEFDQNKEMWNLMNEYNSPASQMQRFKEAGLNPMLAYSQATSGNASSPVSYSRPSVNIQPTSDRQKQLAQAADVLGMITNLTSNITSLVDQGLNLQLKKNEVAASNFNRAYMSYAFPAYGSSDLSSAGAQIFGPGYRYNPEVMNPLSEKFDPYMFLAFQNSGKLPVFWNQFLTGESTRELQNFKSQYQEYYNQNLLPKFNDYQQGKIDKIGFENYLLEYQKNAVDMLPPQLKGILAPLFEYLGPLVRLIFK